MHINSFISDVATEPSVSDDTSSVWIIAVVAVVAIALIGVGFYVRRTKSKKSSSPDS